MSWSILCTQLQDLAYKPYQFSCSNLRTRLQDSAYKAHTEPNLAT